MYEPDDAPLGGLTRPQARALRMACAGYHEAQIASDLAESVDHVRYLFRCANARLKARNRCHLVALWLAAIARERIPSDQRAEASHQP